MCQQYRNNAHKVYEEAGMPVELEKDEGLQGLATVIAFLGPRTQLNIPRDTTTYCRTS